MYAEREYRDILKVYNYPGEDLGKRRREILIQSLVEKYDKLQDTRVYRLKQETLPEAF